MRTLFAASAAGNFGEKNATVDAQRPAAAKTGKGNATKIGRSRSKNENQKDKEHAAMIDALSSLHQRRAATAPLNSQGTSSRIRSRRRVRSAKSITGTDEKLEAHPLASGSMTRLPTAPSMSASSLPQISHHAKLKASGSRTNFIARHGVAVKAVVDSGRKQDRRPGSSSSSVRLQQQQQGRQMITRTHVLPWNNPKTSKRRIPIVAQPPFELRKTTSKSHGSIRDLAQANNQRKRKKKRKAGGTETLKKYKNATNGATSTTSAADDKERVPNHLVEDQRVEIDLTRSRCSSAQGSYKVGQRKEEKPVTPQSATLQSNSIAPRPMSKRAMNRPPGLDFSSLGIGSTQEKSRGGEDQEVRTAGNSANKSSSSRSNTSSNGSSRSNSSNGSKTSGSTGSNNNNYSSSSSSSNNNNNKLDESPASSRMDQGARPPSSTSFSTSNLMQVLDEEDDEHADLCLNSPDALERTYEFSESGGFTIQGFQIQESGITRAPPNYKESLPEGNTKNGLIKLATLGRGASGVVHEMLHIPTLSLVAVKSIPCFEQGKRHQMIKELKALYSNLVPIERPSSSLAKSSASGSLPESLPTCAEQGGARQQQNPQARQQQDGSTSPECPFIVAFHDAFINPQAGNISIVMEYMDGGSLQDVVDSGGCDNEAVLASIAESVLRALLFLHKRRQIHRDIKPSNLLINYKGQVKVSDFGIVRDVGEGQANVDTFVGTMVYMSPERINGSPYSFPSDIWSYGLSLMSCALGHFPISTAGGYWEILHTLNHCPMPALPADRFSPEFCDFITLCLEKSPERRPSAADLLMHPFLKAHSSSSSSKIANEDNKEKLDEICAKWVHYKLAKVGLSTQRSDGDDLLPNKESPKAGPGAGSGGAPGADTGGASACAAVSGSSANQNSSTNLPAHLVAATSDAGGAHANANVIAAATVASCCPSIAVASAATNLTPQQERKGAGKSKIDMMGHCTCEKRNRKKCAFCLTSTFTMDGSSNNALAVCSSASSALNFIPRFSKHDSASLEMLSDQLGLPNKYVRSRMNVHIARGNEYLRRFRLYYK